MNDLAKFQAAVREMGAQIADLYDRLLGEAASVVLDVPGCECRMRSQAQLDRADVCAACVSYFDLEPMPAQDSAPVGEITKRVRAEQSVMTALLAKAHAAGRDEMAAVLFRVLPYLLKCGGAEYYLRDLGVSDALSQKARDEEIRPEFDEEADDWDPVGEDTLRALIDELATNLPRSSP